MLHKAIIISGPTGTGKSDWAVKIGMELLAYKIQNAIINFDSLCFYNELNVGTAKPDLAMRSKVPHYLIDIASIKDEVNAYQFSIKAEQVLLDLVRKGQIPILVGGSPFYLRALLKGMYSETATGEEEVIDKSVLKKSLEKTLAHEGINSFVDYLKLHDPEVLNKVHVNDKYRIMRAVEYHAKTGNPISQQAYAFHETNPFDFGQHKFKNVSFLHIYLDIPKERHWELLRTRAKNMLKNGLIEEVELLLKKGFSGSERPLLSIGYKETIEYLQGTLKSKNEIVEKTFISTRQLAKSQRTFFKKITPKELFDPQKDSDKILKTVFDFIKP